jgi:hypothetical protein
VRDRAISARFDRQIAPPPPPAVQRRQSIQPRLEHATGGLASGGSPTGAGGVAPGDGSSTAGGGGAIGGDSGAGGDAGGSPVSGVTGTLPPATNAPAT